MIDVVIAVLLWLLGSALMRALEARSSEEPPEDHAEINMRDVPDGVILVVKIYMEQVGEWWYGWFHNEDGSEVFIGQGDTYDTALNNCRERIFERAPRDKVKFIFEMKHANSTIQNEVERQSS